MDPSQVGTGQVGSGQVGTTKVGLLQVTTAQVSGTKVDPPEVGAAKVGFFQFGVTEAYDGNSWPTSWTKSASVKNRTTFPLMLGSDPSNT